MADPKTPEQQKAEDDRKRREAEQKAQADKAKAQSTSASGTSPSKPAPKATGTVGGGFGAPMGGVINQPVSYGHDDIPSISPEPLTAEDIRNFAGDLAAGEIGYIELDEFGEPKGPALKEIPDPGVPVARVVGSPVRKYDEVVTPAGAPLTRNMNPAPDLWDAGMLARNPHPVEETKAANERIQKMRDKLKEIREIGRDI